MNKKILYFLGGILLLIIIVVSFIFYLLNKNKQATTVATGTSTQQPATTQTTAAQTTAPATTTSTSGTATGAAAGTSSTTPATAAATAKPAKVSDTSVISPIFSYDDSAVWYFTANGHLYKQDISSGVKQEYILPSQLNVSNIIWPITGNDFIVETDTGTTKVFNYYSSKLKTYTQYPSNVREVDFMKDGVHVVYQWDNGNGTSTISTANADLSSHVMIGNINDTDDIIKASPNTDKAFAYKNNKPTDGKIYYIDLDAKKIGQIKTAANNAAIWAPDGEHFIFDKLPPTTLDPTSTELWLGNFEGQDAALGVTTALNKITFDTAGQNIYMAIPAADGSGDAFWKIAVSSPGTKHQFYPVASSSGGSGSSGVAGVNATNLLISTDGATLLYKNSADGYLYSIPANG